MEANIKPRCSKCDLEKEPEEFYYQNQHTLARHSTCKKCWLDEGYFRKIKRYYGVTKTQYLDMLQEQGGVCAICKNADKYVERLAVDHNHVTGQVRGLLCRRCNQALGALEDDVELLASAIDYLTVGAISNR